MTTVLLLAVLFGSVVAIILMVYLIDRVKRLELLSIQASGNISDEAPAQNDNGFLGLSGKLLWDAMSGKIPEGFIEADLVALKSRFEFVLQNHIETLFKLGKRDSSNGNHPETPSNPIEISTLRGSVASWMPAQHVSTIYKAGHESVGADAITLDRLKSDVDECTGTLFSRTGLTIKYSFSEKLLAPPAAKPIPNADVLIELDEEPF